MSGTPPEPSGGHYGQFMIDEPLGWNGIARLAMQEPVVVGLLQVSEIRHFHRGLLWPPTYFDLFLFLLFLLIFSCFTLPSSHSQVKSGHFSTQTDGVGHPSIAGERPIHLDNVSLFGHHKY